MSCDLTVQNEQKTCYQIPCHIFWKCINICRKISLSRTFSIAFLGCKFPISGIWSNINFREYHSKTSFLTVCSFSPANLTFIHESYGMLITISGLVPLLLQHIINLIKLDTSNTTKFILNHCLHYT